MARPRDHRDQGKRAILKDKQHTLSLVCGISTLKGPALKRSGVFGKSKGKSNVSRGTRKGNEGMNEIEFYYRNA